jgi:hypothetical protein
MTIKSGIQFQTLETYVQCEFRPGGTTSQHGRRSVWSGWVSHRGCIAWMVQDDSIRLMFRAIPAGLSRTSPTRVQRRPLRARKTTGAVCHLRSPVLRLRQSCGSGRPAFQRVRRRMTTACSHSESASTSCFQTSHMIESDSNPATTSPKQTPQFQMFDASQPIASFYDEDVGKFSYGAVGAAWCMRSSSHMISPRKCGACARCELLRRT